MHSTNYYNTLIEIAEDCPVQTAEIPEPKGASKTIAALQFEMIIDQPYRYTSDEVIFNTYAAKNNLTSNLEQEKNIFFSKGQACLRASPLTKRYGWGVHHNAEGKVALYPVESTEYQSFVMDPKVKKIQSDAFQTPLKPATFHASNPFMNGFPNKF